MPSTTLPAAAPGLPVTTRRSALAVLTSCAGGAVMLAGRAVGASAAEPHPDALLLALVDEAEALSRQDARLTDAIDHDRSLVPAWEAMGRKRAILGHRIAEMPAVTLDGFRAKARTLARIYPEGFAADSMDGLDGDTTDAALVRSILFGLLALEPSCQNGGAA